MESQYIKRIVKEGPFFTHFDLSNVNIGIANAIRRSIINNVQTTAIDKVNIVTNTSSFHNEIIQHRVELIPINLPVSDGVSHELRLEIQNDSHLILEVTAHDFKLFTDGKEDTSVDMSKIFPFNCTIVKLKRKQKINMNVYVTTGRGKNHSKFSAISTATYRNKTSKDMNEISMDITSFDEQNYLRNESGTPVGFIFTIESIGILPNRDVCKIALDNLIEDLRELSEKDVMMTNLNVDGAAEFVLQGYDHTVGHLLTYFADKTISDFCIKNKIPDEIYEQQTFVAYKKEHPLKNSIKFVIRVPDDSPAFSKMNGPVILVEAIKTAIDELSAISTQLMAAFDQ